MWGKRGFKPYHCLLPSQVQAIPSPEPQFPSPPRGEQSRPFLAGLNDTPLCSALNLGPTHDTRGLVTTDQ